MYICSYAIPVCLFATADGLTRCYKLSTDDRDNSLCLGIMESGSELSKTVSAMTQTCPSKLRSCPTLLN